MAGFPSPKKGNKLGEPARLPRPGVPLRKEDVLKLIGMHRGNLSKVADSLGCERHSIRRFIDKDPELQKALSDSRERWLDKLEDCVWTRAEESNDTTLQLFLLKTQGKHRGYEQDENKNAAKDIASAAFDYILNKSKNPAERTDK